MPKGFKEGAIGDAVPKMCETHLFYVIMTCFVKKITKQLTTESFDAIMYAYTERKDRSDRKENILNATDIETELR